MVKGRLSTRGSAGENKSLSKEKGKRALGDKQVGRIASQLGVSEDQAAGAVARCSPTSWTRWRRRASFPTGRGSTPS
jgi:uncharacterized protein YidB (DUF937 family)